MGAMSERKIDCHCHILDPGRHPYRTGATYRPSAQEIGTLGQYRALCEAYAVDHALLVGPNSGYGTDNRCLLDAIETSDGKFKGVAVVDNDASARVLAALERRGIVGIAINATYHGVDHYRDIAPLIRRLVDLDMFLQIQVEANQLLALLPLVADSRVKLLIDHCGRPIVADGLAQSGFAALRRLAATERAAIKLSGLYKFSGEAYPYADCWRYIRALVDAFGIANCLWGSDWPYLRAPERIDYGPMLTLVDRLFPHDADRKAVLWDNPRRLLGFGVAC